MVVVYLIGNGFDLQLGLQTSYKDFYEYYIERPSSDDLIAHMKEHINDYLEEKKNRLPEVNWEDLEMALGKYTKELKNYEELRTVYLDVNRELKNYLASQESMFVRDNAIFSKLRIDFSRPEQYLSTNERRRYSKLIDGSTGLFILTLNYTRCCEFLYEKDNPTNNSKGNNTTLRELSHIHGDLEMLNVLVGVNDVSQIANESLRNDIRVNQMLVKPATNDMIDNEKNPHVSRILKNANVIAIYGASLGDSDMFWREQLKECMKSESCYFLINEWQDDFDNIYDLNIVENEARYSFLKKLGLEDESEKYGKYIFVAVTKKMFKPVAEK